MIFTATLAALALFQNVTPPPQPAPTAVVATLNGKPITAAEVEPFLWSWRSRDVIREYADHRMILEAAAKRGLSASDAEVKERLDSQLATIKAQLPQGQTVDAFLASKGLNMDHLALSARSSILLDKISEADFKPEEFYKADTLVFRTTGDTTDGLRGAIKAADAAYAQLISGTPWDKVVKASTDGPNAIGGGGTMGWKAASVFPESVRAQFAMLKPMGYTKPTQTTYGIQIFRLDARGKDAPAPALAELKKQYIEGSRSVVLQRLRAEAKVEIK